MYILSAAEIKQFHEKLLERIDILIKNVDTKNLSKEPFVLKDKKTKTFSEINFLWNGGDIRTMNIELLINKKRIKISFEDYSIGAGKYVGDLLTEQNKNRFFERNYPTCWQTYNIQHIHYFGIHILIKDTFEEILPTEELFEILKPLFKLVYLTNEERINKTIIENLNYRKESFKGNLSLEALSEENINCISPIIKNDNLKRNTWNQKFVFFFNGETLENFVEISNG